MNAILAGYSISMSDFKRNPAQVLRNTGERPVAVLNHNRPAFYMITPKLFKAMVEQLADRDLAELVRGRLAARGGAIEVDLSQL